MDEDWILFKRRRTETVEFEGVKSEQASARIKIARFTVVRSVTRRRMRKDAGENVGKQTNLRDQLQITKSDTI